MIKINQNKRKELKAAQVRQQRDRLLTECDWRSLPDAPGNRDAWLKYRQELRDISKMKDFPFVELPIKPED